MMTAPSRHLRLSAPLLRPLSRGRDYLSLSRGRDYLSLTCAGFALSFPLVAGFPQAALAADEFGIYGSLRTGGVYTPDTDLNNGTYQGRSMDLEGSYNTGYWIGGAVGMNFLPHWRVEGEIWHQSVPFNELTTVSGGQTTIYTDMTGEFSMLGGGVNAYYDIPLGLDSWFPYVGLGLGWNSTHADLEDTGGSWLDDYDSGMNWQAILGMGFRINESWMVNLDYRYQGAQDATFHDNRREPIELAYGGHKLTLGVTVPLDGDMPTFFGRKSAGSLPAVANLPGEDGRDFRRENNVEAQRRAVARNRAAAGGLMGGSDRGRNRDYNDAMRPEDNIVDPFALQDELNNRLSGLMDRLNGIERSLDSIRQGLSYAEYGAGADQARGKLGDLLSQMDRLKREMDALDPGAGGGEIRPRLTRLEENARELGATIASKQTDDALAEVHKILEESRRNLAALDLPPLDGEPGAGTGMGADMGTGMGTGTGALAGSDQPLPDMQASDDGPRIPAGLEMAAASSAASGARPAGSIRGLRVQLASYRSRRMAESGWAQLVRRNGDLLTGLDKQLIPVDLGPKGIYYRIYVTGFSSKGQASALCNRLQGRGDSCVVSGA